MKPKSAIQKGKLLEDWVCDQIREKGIDPKAYRSHGSGNGNREKSDIWTSAKMLGQNMGIECKNQKVIKIPDWWRQTKKLESLGREPVLVFKENMAKMEDTLCVIYFDTLLELIKGQNGATLAPEQSLGQSGEMARELKYSLARAKQSLNQLIKDLEKYGD